MIAAILAFISSIISEVLTDALNTPAVKTTVEEAEAPLPTIVTSTDELLAQYGGLLDRD